MAVVGLEKRVALENDLSDYSWPELTLPIFGFEYKAERNAGIAGKAKKKKERATQTKGELKKLSRFFVCRALQMGWRGDSFRSLRIKKGPKIIRKNTPKETGKFL